MENFEHLRISLEEIKQVTNNFGDEHYLGKGGFGKVFKGELLSEGRTMVAIKRLDRELGQGDVEFWKEIMLLSSHKHENIVSLVGFCDENKEKILVYKYAPNKSLDLHLRNANLTWSQRLNICIGAARGLEYLHDPKGTQQRILHRDIKSANILLDKKWNAKIADFGLSKFGPANQEYTFLVSNAVGTIGYCDPIYAETMLLTKESDVYSFGVVLFEVLCSRHCFEKSGDGHHRVLPILAKKYYQENKLDMIIDDNIMQQIIPACFDTFTEIAYQCIQREQKDRPSMELIVSNLETALEYQEGRIEPSKPKKERIKINEKLTSYPMLKLEDEYGPAVPEPDFMIGEKRSYGPVIPEPDGYIEEEDSYGSPISNYDDGSDVMSDDGNDEQ